MANDIVQLNATVLSMPQLSAISAIVGGSSVTHAATQAGVDRTTVHRWMAQDPEFAAALNQAKRDALAAIRSEVRAGAADAIKFVRKCLKTPTAGYAVRLRAASMLLNSVGALVPEPIGSTNPDDIRAEKSREEFSRMLSNIGV